MGQSYCQAVPVHITTLEHKHRLEIDRYRLTLRSVNNFHTSESCVVGSARIGALQSMLVPAPTVVTGQRVTRML